MAKQENKVYKKVCPDCGKEITSLSKNQCDHNFEVHKMSCKKENEKNAKEIQINKKI